MKISHKFLSRFIPIIIWVFFSLQLFSAPLIYTYDANNRLIQAIYPNDRTVSFQYDPNGNLTGVTSTGGTDGPVVNTQPVYRPMETGETLSLFITATGTGLTYQWYKDGAALTNGGDITGADSANLNIANLAADDQGVYYCIVTDGSANTVQSDDVYVYVLDSGTSDLWTSTTKLGPGSTFNIFNFEIYDQSGDFLKCPKITGELVEPIQGKIKTYSLKAINTFPAENLECLWKNTVPLYDKTGLKNYYKLGYSCEDFLNMEPQSEKDTYIKVQISGGFPQYLSRLFTLVPPEITDIKNSDESSSITSAAAGDTIVIIGNYFGEKTPGVWIEYNTMEKPEKKQLRLKILKPLEYTNSKGLANSSCMELSTGASKIKIIIPDSLPTGLIKGSNNIVIDNKQGLTSFPFDLQ